MNETTTPPVTLTIAQADAQKAYDSFNQTLGQIAAASDLLSKAIGLLVVSKETTQATIQKFAADLKPMPVVEAPKVESDAPTDVA